MSKTNGIVEQVYIYGLCQDGIVKYVGKARHPRTRFFLHLSKVVNRTCQSKKAQWLANLLLNRQPPVMMILDIVSSDVWEAKEREWIQRYSENDLVNGRAGGGGTYTSIMRPKKPRKEYRYVHQVGDIISLEVLADIDRWLALYGTRIKQNMNQLPE
jgi:hypothetical protein